MFHLGEQVQIAESEGIPVEDMAIYNQGAPLSDDLLLSGNIAELTTLTVEARMLGGELLENSTALNVRLHSDLPAAVHVLSQQLHCFVSKEQTNMHSDCLFAKSLLKSNLSPQRYKLSLRDGNSCRSVQETG